MLKETHCPHCDTAWREEESIYEYFLRTNGGNEEEARKSASNYGCTEDNPKHFGKNIIGVEVRGYYDGVAYWRCDCCKSCFDRFTGERFEESEVKDRYTDRGRY